jgi:hypothetical protein
MYTISLKDKNSRQLKDVGICHFGVLHLKTYPDLSIELETSLEICPGHIFPHI